MNPFRRAFFLSIIILYVILFLNFWESEVSFLKLLEQYRGLRKEIYVLFFCELIDNAGSMVGPLLTLILSTKMGLDAGSIATYFLVYTALSLPIHLLGGKLTDRMNKKLLINLCDISTSLLYIFCGFCELSYAVLALYLLGSLIQTVESPVYKSLIADFTSVDDRDRAYSLSYLGLNLGLVLAPILGSVLMKDHLGLLFILSGVFELFSLLIFDLFVKDTGIISPSGNTYEEQKTGESVWRILRNGHVLIPFLAIFSLSMLVYNMYSYLIPLDLTAIHGDDGSIFYGTISSLNCATVLIFTAVLTAVFSKRTDLDKMIAGNLFEIVGLSLFFFFFGKPVVYYVAIVLFTFGEILNTTTTTPYLTKRIPSNYRGRVLAVMSVSSHVTVSLGKYVIGKIYDLISPTTAWVVVLVLGVLTVLAYLLIKALDRKTFPALYSKSR